MPELDDMEILVVDERDDADHVVVATTLPPESGVTAGCGIVTTDFEADSLGERRAHTINGRRVVSRPWRRGGTHVWYVDVLLV
ncbi:hypothetical protein [Deinococcus pimensis]|uniref:hypothetical protein n=1 Tax=Deinococcus pimensis TaxID=309888 RepID=UPI0012F7DADE|nr:hypothetical protein [Deinococcus pimensis]